MEKKKKKRSRLTQIWVPLSFQTGYHLYDYERKIDRVGTTGHAHIHICKRNSRHQNVKGAAYVCIIIKLGSYWASAMRAAMSGWRGGRGGYTISSFYSGVLSPGYEQFP